MMRTCSICVFVLGLVTPAFAEPSLPDAPARVDQARHAVDLAAKVVDLEVQDEWDLRVAWDRAVAQDHPVEAGRYAAAHADAVVAVRRAQDGLRLARSYLTELQHAE